MLHRAFSHESYAALIGSHIPVSMYWYVHTAIVYIPAFRGLKTVSSISLPNQANFKPSSHTHTHMHATHPHTLRCTYTILIPPGLATITVIKHCTSTVSSHNAGCQRFCLQTHFFCACNRSLIATKARPPLAACLQPPPWSQRWGGWI